MGEVWMEKWEKYKTRPQQSIQPSNFSVTQLSPAIKKTFVWNNTFSCHFAVRFCLVHWYSKELSFESHFGMFFLSVLFSSAAVFQTSRVNSLVLQKKLPHWLVVRCLAYSLVFICSVSGILSCLCEDNIQGLFLLKAVHSEVLIILGELTL